MSSRSTSSLGREPDDVVAGAGEANAAVLHGEAVGRQLVAAVGERRRRGAELGRLATTRR